jgi:ribosomal protein S18 acetylase RimI-like enzyme
VRAVTVIRRAVDGDADAIGDIQVACFATNLPDVATVHPPAAVRSWIARDIVPKLETWVVERGGTILAFLALDVRAGILDQLYVAPHVQGSGLGSSLVDLAKERSGGRLRLWCFQSNAAARGFYERRGFRLVELSDGSRNEEREPDALYEWVACATR